MTQASHCPPPKAYGPRRWTYNVVEVRPGCQTSATTLALQAGEKAFHGTPTRHNSYKLIKTFINIYLFCLFHLYSDNFSFRCTDLKSVQVHLTENHGSAVLQVFKILLHDLTEILWVLNLEPDSAILVRRLSPICHCSHNPIIPHNHGPSYGIPAQGRSGITTHTADDSGIPDAGVNHNSPLKADQNPSTLHCNLLLVFYTLTVTGYLQTSIRYGSNSRFISSTFIIYAIIRSSRLKVHGTPGTRLFSRDSGLLRGLGSLEVSGSTVSTSRWHSTPPSSTSSHLHHSLASTLRRIVAPIHRSFTGGHLARLLIPIMMPA